MFYNMMYFFFPSSDEQQWRNLIVWLEDQKIRMYKIEDRKRLRDTSTGNWSKAFSQVGHYQT